MPLYEFVCDECGERFEALVDMGTESVECRNCGKGTAKRVLSAHAAPMHLVKTPRQMRKQERANAELRKRTKERFKAARKGAREAKGGKGS